MSKPSVLIIGGGAFGTSTAFHLNKRGYKSVTVLDRFDAPSTDAAATDLNKVIRFDYPNPLYSALGREAYDAWTSPSSLFAGLYRKTGWIMSGHDMTVDWLKNAFSRAKEENRQDVSWLSAEGIRSRWPAFSGQFPGWTNLFSGNAGWVRISSHTIDKNKMYSIDTYRNHTGTFWRGAPANGKSRRDKWSQICLWAVRHGCSPHL